MSTKKAHYLKAKINVFSTVQCTLVISDSMQHIESYFNIVTNVGDKFLMVK